MKGNKISVGYIDTVMVTIPFNFELKYKYITECIDNNRDKHVYVDEDLCCHNFKKITYLKKFDRYCKYFTCDLATKKCINTLHSSVHDI